jgi:hypothetical protein
MSCEKTVRPEFTRHWFTPSIGEKRSIQPLSNSNRSCFIFNKLGRPPEIWADSSAPH